MRFSVFARVLLRCSGGFQMVVCVLRVVARTLQCSCCGVQVDARMLLRVC